MPEMVDAVAPNTLAESQFVAAQMVDISPRKRYFGRGLIVAGGLTAAALLSGCGHSVEVAAQGPVAPGNPAGEPASPGGQANTPTGQLDKIPDLHGPKEITDHLNTIVEGGCNRFEWIIAPDSPPSRLPSQRPGQTWSITSWAGCYMSSGRTLTVQTFSGHMDTKFLAETIFDEGCQSYPEIGLVAEAVREEPTGGGWTIEADKHIPAKERQDLTTKIATSLGASIVVYECKDGATVTTTTRPNSANNSTLTKDDAGATWQVKPDGSRVLVGGGA